MVTRYRHITLLLSEQDFERWLISAPRGAWACYYEGDLANDRMAANDCHANVMGTRAWARKQAGTHLLVQSRIPEQNGKFRYLIVRRR